MTVLRNNLDVGPDATTITTSNSNDNGGDAFDGVYAPGATGNLIEYSDDIARSTATYVMHVKTGATAAAPAVLWTTAMGTQSQIWTRFYVHWQTTVPTAGMVLLAVQGSTAYCAQIGLATGQKKLTVQVGAGGVGHTYSAISDMVPDTWYRVEMRMQTSLTTANGELRYYFDADSDVATETITWSGENSANATMTAYQLGYVASAANWPDTYFSGWELNTVDWPGPAPRRVGTGSPSGNLTNPVAIHSDCF